MEELLYPPLSLFYDGRVQPAHSDNDSCIRTYDPSTNRGLADVYTSTEQDVDSAIESAKAAFPAWSAKIPLERSRILLKAVQLLRERNDNIAKVETRDTGKPFSETSTVDVVTGADVLEYFANLVAAGGLNGESIRLRDDAWVYTSKEPLGVCTGIGAWNYPIQMYVQIATSPISTLQGNVVQSALEVRTMFGGRQHYGL